MKRIGFARVAPILALTGAAVPALADDFGSDVVYTRDVAPIMVEHCVSCHRPGEGAPMTLTSYAETRPWAKSIRAAVTSREMPPWDADPNHGKWANDISLSDDEIAAIAKWVDAGAPEGDPALMPAMPATPEGWTLGQPDYVIELPEIDVKASERDYFPNLNVTIDIPERRWLRAVEVNPGNLEVMHHIVLFTAGGVGMGADGAFNALAVWAVGTPPVIYPEGMGRWVEPKTNLIANMHYHPSTTVDHKDKSTIGLYFGEGEMEKEIVSGLAGKINFAIPPHAENYEERSSFYIDQDVRVISLFPHLHMRGKHMSFLAHYPDGRTETLLRVPNYDFNWQWFYYPSEPLILPAETEIELIANWDNSANNPNNPDPTKELTFGEASDEEMMFGLFEYVPVEGKKLIPIPAKEKVLRMARRQPEGTTYLVDLNMMMMRTSTALHLPREGNGTWFFAFGSQMMPMDITNLKWNGDEFEFDLDIMGGRFGKVKGSGKVTADGKIEGKFDATGFQMPNPMGDEPVPGEEIAANDADDAEADSDAANAESGETEAAGDGREGRRGRRGRGGRDGGFNFLSNQTFKGELVEPVKVGSAN